MDLTTVVAAFLDGHGLTGTGGVVAVSGGPDSVALAHALLTLRRGGLLSALSLGHVNHRLRGDESDADAAFVAGLPAQWCPDGSDVLACRVVCVDSAAEARRRRQNLEAVAREQRYAALAAIGRDVGAAWVATAHTADDQAETVLFRLLRGSGLEGLRGMAPLRPLEGSIALVRPLLGVRRADVHAYLAAHGLPSRQDRSNLDTALTRNRIRHELLPQLRAEYNPALVELLSGLAEQARQVQAEMRGLAEKLLAAAELPRAGAVLVFRADVLAAAPLHRAREVFRLVWQREGWPQGAMGFAEWQRLAEVAHGTAVAWDLPGGIHVRRAGAVLQLRTDCPSGGAR